MSNPQQQKPAVTTTTQQTTAAKPMTDFERLLDKKVMEFIPFGGQEKVKLTVRIIQDLIAVPTANGFKPSEKDCIKFMMMCQARLLNPFEGDAFMIGYDTRNGPTFSLITAHQAFLKRAEVHAEYDGMESGIIIFNEDDGSLTEREGDFHLKDEKIVGGWAKVFFKNRSHPTTRKIRMERFDSGYAQWAKDPAGMIVKCAEADALRSSFPTMIGGLYLREEVDFLPIKPEMLKPLFESSQSQPETTAGPAATTQPENGTSVPEGETKAPESETQPPTGEDGDLGPQPPTQPEKPSLLKAVRNLCKIGKVREGVLLGFLAETGATDGSVGSLEELAMSNSTLLQSIHDKFPEMAEKIKQATKDPRGAA